ncbi:MAG: NADH-quinone oxidoreductase subunit J [Candidatus Rokubacteria bacterium]|nr:NADH-quinone oxidoreductase subunit J [Candidatus Rokubacteria bacterium]
MAMAVFVLFAVLAIGCACGLVLKRNPIHGALFLVGNLASVAALYLTMRAEFLAVVQVLVYAGAIVVLFVFAIMVLIPGKEETGPDPLRAQRWLAVPVAGFLLLLAALVLRSTVLARPAVGGDPSGSLYRVLLTDYLFPFEAVSVLLLTAIIGVVALTRGRPL